ncbi:MAG: UDP-N-acetylglucosamine--N-acetylmuramyl-(pentapeptide) pyrophosphoryl-undecaprenol N-acetylglucosamine transferase [Planctomycetota bacterium]|nr:UDP-N-acetylglucosamine--N-acetylmuramyl-(pentapeptide) pyrophosphoryl-undecaprenol N-acetylglucosamine transferase [Planctomycetota bacterium]
MTNRCTRPVGAGRVIVLAGGGSGGHIAPGLAIAERLAQLDPTIRCVYACSTRAIDASMLSDAGAVAHPIPAQPPSLHPMKLLRFVRSILPASRASTRVMRDLSPAWVIALGGFVSVPVVSAAKRAGVPVLLVNLDAVAGRANQWVSRRADVVVSAVPTNRLAVAPLAIVGVPLRRCAMPSAGAEESRAALGLDPTTKTLLVTGASQGAGSLNHFMMAFASAPNNPLKGWQVIHQCGPQETDAVALRDAYVRAGVRALVIGFIQRMGLAWGSADLALSRGGANLVWEARAAAVPTLFAPYPWHKDRHQAENARELVEVGGALIVDDEIEVESNMRSIGTVLDRVLHDDAARTTMRAKLSKLDRVDAAERIAAWLVGRCGW